ncbi:hypothetical protein Cantr_00866 [Candida viswanathii]|uniref:Uncharacterized protein n=1 Tax=Candida viswanathii TaxID=5486 RepID=A0A367YG50_9ASCO|nr:hypothetical protein Cantr_00866 [Candida viswanathii]
MVEPNDYNIHESTNSDNESIRAVYEYKLVDWHGVTSGNSSCSTLSSFTSDDQGRGYYLGIVKPENYNHVVFLRNDYSINYDLSVCFISRVEPLRLVSYDDANSTYTVMYENDTLIVTLSISHSFIDTFIERLASVNDE